MGNKIRHLQMTTAQWAAVTVPLDDRRLGIEVKTDGSRVYKMGDGVHLWAALPSDFGGGEGGGIPEAPTDGKQYARQNQAWSEVSGDGATVLSSTQEGGGGGSFALDEFYTQFNGLDAFAGITSELCDIDNLLAKIAELRATVNGAVADVNAAVATIDGKMNQFTISAGAFVVVDRSRNYSEIYLVTALSPELLNYLENTEWVEFSFRCNEPFHAEFEHIGNEYVTHEGQGWTYTDGFMVAYDDTTGEMTRWSAPGGNARVDAVIDTSGLIKFTPKNPSDEIQSPYDNGFLLEKTAVSTTFDGIDVYNKGVADKEELSQLIAALQGQRRGAGRRHGGSVGRATSQLPEQ